MSLRAVLIQTGAVLFSGITMATAQSVSGPPEQLIGLFAKNASLCKSSQRQAGKHILIDRDQFYDYQRSCGGKQCIASIVSHTKEAWGFVIELNTHTKDAPTDWTEGLYVKRINDNVFDFRLADTDTPRVFVRCPQKS